MEEQKGIPLIKPGTAYQSLRESGFDFSTAIGELIDNSIDAKAKRIEIIPKIVERKFEGRSKPVSVITQIAVVDDGNGMDTDKLNSCPQLGFSTRYNRKGLGRFGVGATYASISQCKRTVFYSRPNGTGNYKATYIDLDEIANKTQTDIPIPNEVYLPKDLEEITSDNSSTIVVWQECDRLQCDANGRPIESSELLDELKEWVSRTYRYKIWDGTEIYINNEKILAHDPLYLNTSLTNFPNDPSSTVKCIKSIKWDIPNLQGKTSTITVKLTLLPEEWRTERGDGGRKPALKRGIPKNEYISILRDHREIAFRNLYPVVPSQLDIDRWWGCEINFEPDLDECWEVKNIKRGANPIKELRNELKKLLTPNIHALRKDIRNYWKRRIPVNKSKHVQDIALSLMEKNNSISPLEVESDLTNTEISIDDVSQILEDLAEEKKWDWTTDGTQRRYTPSPPPLSESERKEYFDGIKSTIENSNIEQRFKDIALYDLEQARISYKSRAFKACIVMFGAVIEGLMLGAICQETTLKKMVAIANQPDAPGTIKQIKRFQSSFSNLECLAENISEHLGFEDYKNITVHLKSEIERLQITGIQSFRNSIHPWKSIKESNIFHDPSQARAMHYLTALSILAKKILA